MPVRRLKIVLLGRSAEPVGAYWDGKKANKWKMIKLKHVQNGENVIVCGKPNSLCCEAGDVISKLSAYQTTKKLANMQCLCSNQNKMVGGSSNYAPARQLKMGRWIALLSLREHTGMKKWQKK